MGKQREVEGESEELESVVSASDWFGRRCPPGRPPGRASVVSMDLGRLRDRGDDEEYLSHVGHVAIEL